MHWRETFDAALVYVMVVVVVFMTGSAQAILTRPEAGPYQECPDRNCKCDNVKIECSCFGSFQNIILHELRSTSATKINITNCQSVTVNTNAIKNMWNLRYVQFNNIKSLRLQDSSLNWCGNVDCARYVIEILPEIEILIYNSTVMEIQSHAIKGRISEIRFEKSNVQNIKPFAITSLIGSIRIEFRDTSLRGVESQAFKKILTENLRIVNSRIGLLKSRTFLDIEVKENLEFQNSYFEHLNPGAFIIQSPKYFEIYNSHFEIMDGDSLKISTKGRVSIKNNIFKKLQPGAFSGLSFIREERMLRQDLLFNNNTLDTLNKDILAFNLTSFNLKIGSIIVNQTCTCADVHIWISGSTWVEDIHCVVPKDKKRTIIKASNFQEQNCTTVSAMWTIIIAVIASVVLILIIVSVVLFFVYRQYKKRKQKEVNRETPTKSSLGLIVPDGRTYRETELHVIIEKAELLTTEL